jgi:hypothetical protein
LATLQQAAGLNAVGQETVRERFYLIGNSLTWDTVPQRLDGDVLWHVNGGVPLPNIYANTRSQGSKQVASQYCRKLVKLGPKTWRDSLSL